MYLILIDGRVDGNPHVLLADALEAARELDCDIVDFYSGELVGSIRGGRWRYAAELPVGRR